ncbi:MAG: SHOCT domain-containing protein [Halodesulfurarchaeum sp.]
MTDWNLSDSKTVVVVLLALVFLLPVLGFGGMMGGGGFGMIGGPIFFGPLLLIALVWLLVASGSDRDGTRSSNRAEDTLRERYARGELTEEEYEKRLRTLRES